MKALPRADLRLLAGLVIALVAARLLFIWLMPVVYSKDLFSWLRVMDVLQSGGNPYRETDVLNWPPFWMQMLFGIHQLAKRTGISPIRLIQAILIFGEILVMIVAFFLGRTRRPAKELFKPLLLGLALNPVSIFLSCQHCNYDVFVGLFILSAVAMLMFWISRQDPVCWLAACFFVGIGILAKTVPVMITPLLLTGIRRISWPVRLFGVALAATPFIIGMSVLFTLEPHGVVDNVVGYRSMGGWYGFSGLIWTAGAGSMLGIYKAISPVLMMSALLFAGWKSYSKDEVSGQTILVRAVLLLVFVTTFGPGYTPPYILWYLPMLVLLYATAAGGLRRLLFWGWLVTIVTYSVEYAFFYSHGAFIKEWWHWEKVAPLCEWLGSRPMQTLIRLPMFLCYLATFVALLRYDRNVANQKDVKNMRPAQKLF